MEEIRYGSLKRTGCLMLPLPGAKVAIPDGSTKRIAG
jgi:hypothetical protein